MNWRIALIAPALGLAAGGCTTDDLALLDSALSLYSDVSYLNGDCPYGLHKYYDREGHHHCSLDDDNPRHRNGTGHNHEE